MNQAIETGVGLRDRMPVLRSAERLVAQGKLSQADLEAEIAQWDENSLSSLIHSMNRFAERLVAQGKLSQVDLEAEIAQIKRELQGDTPNGSQMATYTAANEREFSELCEQYSQTLIDVKEARAARDLAYANADEASKRLDNKCWKERQTEERLKAYALLFGFSLPDEITAPEYVGEEDIPF